METKILTEEYKDEFDSIVQHPLQSWAWGEFKEKNNCIAERIGFFENGQLVNGLQVIFSKLPKTKYTVGYMAKGIFPTKEQVEILRNIAAKHNAIFIKLEPNLCVPVNDTEIDTNMKDLNLIEKQKQILSFGFKSGKPFFTRYDFHLDISKNEDELMASFHSKTRYNIRLAKKRGVTIIDNSTEEGMQNYIRLMEETTKRQGFFNHNAEYFKKLFEYFPKDRLRIFQAMYNEKVLTAWILFNFNGSLYYPYGASSNEHREVMPNNLIAWEAIKYGKNQGCNNFDMWGCLGPNPDKNDSWYGFHRFKAGYNPQLVKYIGSYDLVCKPFLYKAFNIADKIRWMILRLKNR